MKRAAAENSYSSLYNGEGWWLPFDDMFLVDLPLHTGQKVCFGTLGHLREELREINPI